MEVEPFKVHLWSSIRHTPKLHHKRPRYRTQPQQDLHHYQYETDNLRKGYTEAQRCMAALSRFTTRLGEKGLLFFKILKASEHLSWLEEADTAFEQLKLFLTKPPIMTVPRPDETLLIYIATTSRVFSTSIIIEHEEVGHAYKVQCLIYFISEVLN